MNLKLLMGGLLLLAIGYLYYKYFYKKKPLYHNPNDLDPRDFIRPVSIKYPDDDEIKTIEITGDKSKKKKAKATEDSEVKDEDAKIDSEVKDDDAGEEVKEEKADDAEASNIKKITVA